MYGFISGIPTGSPVLSDTPEERQRAVNYTWIDDTPIGRLLLAGNDDGLRYLLFDHGSSTKRHKLPLDEWEENSAVFKETARQLKGYFAGSLKQFDLPLAAAGTPFQMRVWKALCDVPYGETASYGEIAEKIGKPTASRAVGMANGRNPISIIIPCHRIIGSSGKLIGYGGGLNRKTKLLQLEGVVV